MRWLWIDRFLEFERGSHAVAIKSVTLAEDAVDEYIPSYPILPCSLIIEGMAQTGGLLVGEMSQFENRVVLAKVSKAVFHGSAFPGDTLRYKAKIESMQPLGAMIKGECYIADSLHAEIDLVFAHLDDRFKGVELFEPANFLRLLRLLKLYEVARDSAGNKLEIPAKMLEAEKAYLSIEQP